MIATAEATRLTVGLHAGLPMRDYLAARAVSASQLELIRRSPKQLEYARSRPHRTTPALVRGEALHMAVLEPDRFDGYYVTLGQCAGLKKDGDRCSSRGAMYRNGKSYCRTHDPEKGVPMAVEVLPETEYTDVLGMRASIFAHPRARTLLRGKGDTEVTGFFVDPDTGVLCKFRPDRLIERAGILMDVKTTRDAAPWMFPRDAEKLGYFRKLALYRRGLRALGWPYQNAAIIAVEPDAPYDLVCYIAKEDDLDAADRENTRLLRLYRQCEAADEWPGYQTGDDGWEVLKRPAWAMPSDDDEPDEEEPWR